jgi:hypothetical protein
MKSLKSIVIIGAVCVSLAPHTAAGIERVTIVVEHIEPASSVAVGMDLGDGRGFGFVTFSDGDNDGMIQLPDLPIGGRLALGVQHAGCGDCGLIWDLSGTEVSPAGTTIEYPLLASATNGASLGVDYGEIAAPPIVLTPGNEFTVTGGLLPGWPGIRLVDDSGVPGLPEFVAAVDALPAFNGDVVVSNVVVRFTVVPEPPAVLLLVIGALGFGPRFTWGGVTPRRHSHLHQPSGEIR